MDFETYITGISLALIIISMFLLVKYLDLTNNMEELIKNSSELDDLSIVEIKVKKLEEEVFCLKHDIEFDSAFQEMSYNLVNSGLNYAYHIEIEYYINFTEFEDSNSWFIDSFYSDMIRAKIMMDGEIVKEIEVSRPFYSVAEIYDYLEAKIKDYDYDIFLSNQLAKLSKKSI